MNHKMVQLPEAEWNGTILPIKYSTGQYYDVDDKKCDAGHLIEIDLEVCSSRLRVTELMEITV